jgi:cell shape-determining protein MreC
MRIAIFIVITYACLSMLFPSWAPLACFESTALLFYRPWDWLSGQGIGSPTMGDTTPAFSVRDPAAAPADEAAGLWERVFTLPEGLEKYTLIGARSTMPLRAEQRHIHYYAGDAPPIRPGDPVVCGGALVGFVRESKRPSQVHVVLLNAPESDSVVGELRGTLAERSVHFVAGEASPVFDGGILIRFASDRFGLAEGSLAYTAKEPLTPRIPEGLFLGAVRKAPPEAGSLVTRAALVPPFGPCDLHRVAVLVPSHRLAEQVHRIVPDLPIKRVSVRARLTHSLARGEYCIRINGGHEKGIAAGNLLWAEGFVVGRIDRVGLFASTARLLGSPGAHQQAAVPSRAQGMVFFGLQVIEQEGLCFRVRSDRPLEDLESGTPVYLTGEPCAGFESGPAYQVVDPEKGREFCIVVPWNGGKEACYGLKFLGVPE